MVELHDHLGASPAIWVGAARGVAVDANGDVYGTTAFGGASDAGVIWEITRN